ncbi:MAG: hypothetical protein ACI8V4_001333 [Ilumatobacter sp.]|jgi:hypothetical protein
MRGVPTRSPMRSTLRNLLVETDERPEFWPDEAPSNASSVAIFDHDPAVVPLFEELDRADLSGG